MLDFPWNVRSTNDFCRIKSYKSNDQYRKNPIGSNLLKIQSNYFESKELWAVVDRFHTGLASVDS